MSHSIFFDLYIKAESSKIFAAITEPAHLENWWPLKCSGEPILGASYNFNFTDDYDWYAKIGSVKKDSHVYYKMTQSDVDWNLTIFGFELSTLTDGKTLIQFSHTGWQSNNHEYRNSAYCWAQLLRGLKEYVENGVVVAFEERS